MIASAAIWLLAAVTVLASWCYFRTWTLGRPPLGTVNLGDVAFTLACIVALPFLYLWLPGWAGAAVLAVTTLSLLWTVMEPVTSIPVVRLGVPGSLVGADIALAWLGETTAAPYLLVNNVAMLAIAIGVSNLWAQGGLRARDMAIMAGAIAVYDLVATGVFPLTGTMLEQLAGMPFLPMVVWSAQGEFWVGIGLGDLLMASVGPLVMRKAYGRISGFAAAAIALGGIASVLVLAQWEAMPEVFPTMVVLGPLMVLHHGFWVRHAGVERTYGSYLVEEPIVRRA